MPMIPTTFLTEFTPTTFLTEFTPTTFLTESILKPLANNPLGALGAVDLGAGALGAGALIAGALIYYSLIPTKEQSHKTSLNLVLAELPTAVAKTAAKTADKTVAKEAHKVSLNPVLDELQAKAKSPSIGIKAPLATTAVTASLVGLATIIPAVAAFMLTPTGIGLGIGLLLAATALAGYLANSKPTEVLEIGSAATKCSATKIQSAFREYSARHPEIKVTKQEHKVKMESVLAELPSPRS